MHVSWGTSLMPLQEQTSTLAKVYKTCDVVNNGIKSLIDFVPFKSQFTLWKKIAIPHF